MTPLQHKREVLNDRVRLASLERRFKGLNLRMLLRQPILRLGNRAIIMFPRLGKTPQPFSFALLVFMNRRLIPLTTGAERRAQRAVAVSFWLLAPYITVEGIHDLAAHHPATTTLLGIALTASSLVIMPVLGIAKRRLGARLGATAGEGNQNLMCAAQAAGVLLALVVVAVWPGGWLVDPIIALGIAAWSAWEGSRFWRGADCC